MYREEDLVDVVEAYGLEPYLGQWLDGPDEPWLPLCPESWSGNRIPEHRFDEAQEVLVGDCRIIERALLSGKVDRALEQLWSYPLRCSEAGTEEPKDWPPGIYLHYLRRLATGDSVRVVHEDLRRVKAELDAPVAYLELLRRRLGSHLERRAEAPKPEDRKRSEVPGTAAFPQWESRDAWLLVGNPLEGEGFLAYGGRMVREVSPQVFKLLFLLKGKKSALQVQQAIDVSLIKPKSGTPEVAFKKLIGRANQCFRLLGAGREESPLHYSRGACHSTVWIRHAPEASRIR